MCVCVCAFLNSFVCDSKDCQPGTPSSITNRLSLFCSCFFFLLFSRFVLLLLSLYKANLSTLSFTPTPTPFQTTLHFFVFCFLSNTQCHLETVAVRTSAASGK